MKNYFQAAIIVALLMHCTTFTFAQSIDVANGYYISTSGDSLNGQLYLGSFKDNVLRFKAPGASDWVNVRPEDLKEARGEKDLYITTQVVVFRDDTARIFVRRVLEGGYSLFEGSREKQVVLYFFNSIERPALVKVNPLGLKVQFQTYFGACANRFIPKLKYSKESLLYFLRQVNDCAYPAQASVQPKRKFLQPGFGIGITAGAFYQAPPKFGTRPYDPMENANFGSSANALGGITATFNVSRTLGLSLGLQYIDKRMAGDSLDIKLTGIYQLINPNTGNTSSVYIDYFYRDPFAFRMKYIELPLSIRFRPRPYNKSGPVVTGGVVLPIPLSVAIKKSWETPYKMVNFQTLDPQPTLENGTFINRQASIEKPLVGVHVGLGWRWELGKHREIELMSQYTRTKENLYFQLLSTDGKIEYPATHNLIWHRFQVVVNYYFMVRKEG